jgi:hypothetical protein
MEPMPMAGSHSPILYAKETERGHWQWMMYFNRTRQSQPANGDYQELLSTLATTTELDPRPLLLFSFAEGHSCGELSNAREGIVQSAKCSEDGVPCIDGTLADFLARS